MTSPMDSWAPGGPSLIELRDQAFEQMREAAGVAVRDGRETVEVNARDLIGLYATAKLYEEIEEESGPRRKRHDHTSTDPWSHGPNGDTAYVDGCPIPESTEKGTA